MWLRLASGALKFIGNFGKSAIPYVGRFAGPASTNLGKVGSGLGIATKFLVTIPSLAIGGVSALGFGLNRYFNSNINQDLPSSAIGGLGDGYKTVKAFWGEVWSNLIKPGGRFLLEKAHILSPESSPPHPDTGNGSGTGNPAATPPAAPPPNPQALWQVHAHDALTSFQSHTDDSDMHVVLKSPNDQLYRMEIRNGRYWMMRGNDNGSGDVDYHNAASSHQFSNREQFLGALQAADALDGQTKLDAYFIPEIQAAQQRAWESSQRLTDMAAARMAGHPVAGAGMGMPVAAGPTDFQRKLEADGIRSKLNLLANSHRTSPEGAVLHLPGGVESITFTRQRNMISGSGDTFTAALANNIYGRTYRIYGDRAMVEGMLNTYQAGNFEGLGEQFRKVDGTPANPNVSMSQTSQPMGGRYSSVVPQVGSPSGTGVVVTAGHNGRLIDGGFVAAYNSMGFNSTDTGERGTRINFADGQSLDLYHRGHDNNAATFTTGTMRYTVAGRTDQWAKDALMLAYGEGLTGVHRYFTAPGQASVTDLRTGAPLPSAPTRGDIGALNAPPAPQSATPKPNVTPTYVMSADMHGSG